MPSTFHLFERIGVELELMLVSDDTLDVLPIADRVIAAECGSVESEIDVGGVSWSNELVLHVLELKMTEPATSLSGWAERFQQQVRRINEVAATLGGRLMPTAMHPWMDPLGETRLWPHDNREVYDAFNRIFDCRGHGWANLQSVHLNLPFANDDEFARLHAAIRLVLPILPALAASSPVVQGAASGFADTRLHHYTNNSRRIPSVAGAVIPEPVFTMGEYRERILAAMYRDIAPLDPAGILQNEWLNARGAIARFERNTIEIRVLDAQECPLLDCAIAAAVVAVVRSLTQERWCSSAQQKSWPVEPLAAILNSAIQAGERAALCDGAYAGLFGLSNAGGELRLSDVWRHLIGDVIDRGEVPAEFHGALEIILEEGSLATRVLRALGSRPGRIEPTALKRVYGRLCECLARGHPFSEHPSN